MKRLFLSVLKNIGRLLLVSFICAIIGFLEYRYFFLKTQPIEFNCGGNLCYSILPRMIEAITHTFFYMSISLGIAIMILFPFAYRKKISKMWIVSCILILLIVRGGVYVIDYVTRKDVTPTVGESDELSLSQQPNKEEITK